MSENSASVEEIAKKANEDVSAILDCYPSIHAEHKILKACQSAIASATADKEKEEQPRIYSRCPSCKNDTLMINKGHLLCTWIDCKDPTLIDRLGETQPRPIQASGSDDTKRFTDWWESVWTLPDYLNLSSSAAEKIWNAAMGLSGNVTSADKKDLEEKH